MSGGIVLGVLLKTPQYSNVRVLVLLVSRRLHAFPLEKSVNPSSSKKANYADRKWGVVPYRYFTALRGWRPTTSATGQLVLDNGDPS